MSPTSFLISFVYVPLLAVIPVPLLSLDVRLPSEVILVATCPVPPSLISLLFPLTIPPPLYALTSLPTSFSSASSPSLMTILKSMPGVESICSRVFSSRIPQMIISLRRDSLSEFTSHCFSQSDTNDMKDCSSVCRHVRKS